MPKYLDHASTAAVHPEVLKSMLPFFSEIFGNASSNHIYAKKAIDIYDLANIEDGSTTY